LFLVNLLFLQHCQHTSIDRSTVNQIVDFRL
jgi:hypothetical protein